MSVTIPRAFRPRLEAAGRAHGHKSWREFADHLLGRGMPPGDGRLEARLDAFVDAKGYSDRDEAILHLLERGLAAYEGGSKDDAAFRDRLRGLGYIE
jgi:hypothetical protein